MTKPNSVLLVEDSRSQREAIATMLARHPDLRLIAAASKPDVALLLPPQSKPDVVLLDLGLQSHDSLRFAERVRREAPEAKVLVMNASPLQSDLVAFVRAGVSGFTLKDATLEDLLDSIQTVVNGSDVLPPALTRSLFSQIANETVQRPKRTPNTTARLTRRELEVVDLIAAGSSNKEIAQHLNIALYTVKSHVHNILEKLALRTRLELAAYARREPARASDLSRPLQQS